MVKKKEETTEEVKPEEVKEEVNVVTEEVKEPTTSQMVDEVVKATERAEKATKELVEANAETARLQARDAVSGRALAGSQPEPKETDDEKWAREAMIRYAGTGMDPT